MNKIDVKFKDRPEGKVEMSFSDSKKTVTIDLSGMAPMQKVARIRDQILAEGYFYSSKIEKKVFRYVGNSR